MSRHAWRSAAISRALSTSACDLALAIACAARSMRPGKLATSLIGATAAAAPSMDGSPLQGWCLGSKRAVTFPGIEGFAGRHGLRKRRLPRPHRDRPRIADRLGLPRPRGDYRPMRRPWPSRAVPEDRYSSKKSSISLKKRSRLFSNRTKCVASGMTTSFFTGALVRSRIKVARSSGYDHVSNSPAITRVGT
jgi:hypothetical protein